MFAVAVGVSGSIAAKNAENNAQQTSPQNAVQTATPIKHLVVIFNENRSFDHYFGTYPNATNPQGEPVFKGAPNTPKVNNFVANPTLLAFNGNSTNRAEWHRRRQSVPPRSFAGEHSVAEPRLYGRTKGLRQRQGRSVPEIPVGAPQAAPAPSAPRAR